MVCGEKQLAKLYLHTLTKKKKKNKVWAYTDFILYKLLWISS